MGDICPSNNGGNIEDFERWGGWGCPFCYVRGSVLFVGCSPYF